MIMKKIYMTPSTEVMKYNSDVQLMTVSSDTGIGFGGVDNEGSLDPASRTVFDTILEM